LITKFGCKNIKAIRDYDKIEIRPVTVIMGENSSGKSSMLQALSLLSVNTIFGSGGIERIKYNNPFSQFGTNDSFKNKNEDVTLFFEIEQDGEKVKVVFTYKDEENNNEYGYLDEVTFYPKNKKLLIYKLSNIKSSKVYKLELLMSTPNLQDCLDNFTQENQLIIKSIMNFANVYVSLDGSLSKVEFKIPDIERQIEEEVKEVHNKIELFLEKPMLTPLNNLFFSLKQIQHIGKLKEKKETYDYSLDYIGYFGENYKQRAVSLKNTRFIKGAIRDIFGYELVVDKRKQELFIEQDKKKLELHMFGSSVNSTIPLLTQFALNRQAEVKNQYRMTIVEEPELNLHPLSQARFIESIIKNIPKKHTTVIETHSDHMINKLASLVNKKVLKPKDIVIYYKKKDSKFQKIELNRCGRFIGDFPEGFFDATLDDIYELGIEC